METGVAVWILNPDQDDDQVWLPGAVAAKTPTSTGFELQIEVQHTDHHGHTSRDFVTVQSPDGGETDKCKRRNDDSLGLVQDLIQLPHLHEPAILHALVERFDAGFIYTYTGPILIAVNPFQRLQLYTEEILESYYNAGILRSQGIETASMAPHVYAIASAAYQDMMLRIRAKLSGDYSGSRGALSQSILISGESGAGKTVSTKVCLEYLTTVGKSAEASEANSVVMERILQSNPILEAFGNARTIRNDNSSRFGKLMETWFSKRVSWSEARSSPTSSRRCGCRPTR